MSRIIKAGIDVGTSAVRVVIAEEEIFEGQSKPKIIGTGLAESKGLHHGYITNQKEVTTCIQSAVAQAEKMAGAKVNRAFVSVGGIGLAGVTTSGSAIVSRADLEITDLDLEKAQEAAETAIPHAVALNKKIINNIPVEYKVDGKIVWGRVKGLKAQKVEVKMLFIMCLDHHLQDIIKSVEEAGIEVIDVVASPIASSFVTLTKRQKKAGCVLVNIGAETMSMVVFENSNPLSLEVFPIGGTDITNDIALCLKIPLDEAESIKVGALTNTNFSKKKLDDIVSARLSDMFELIEGHLKKISRNALLPAGIVITGGSSHINNLKDLAESSLKLPSQIGALYTAGDDTTTNGKKSKDVSWSVAYGLAILGFNAEDEQKSIGLRGVEKIAEGGKRGLRVILDWIKQFLP